MKADSNLNNLPLAITLGDPAGIGPELAIKIMSDQKFPVPNAWFLLEICGL